MILRVFENHNSITPVRIFSFFVIVTVNGFQKSFWYKMFLFVAFEVVFFFLHSLCVSLSTICFHFIWICSKQTWMKRISVPEVEKSLDAPLNRMFNWPKIWRPTTPEGVKKQITKYPIQSQTQLNITKHVITPFNLWTQPFISKVSHIRWECTVRWTIYVSVSFVRILVW